MVRASDYSIRKTQVQSLARTQIFFFIHVSLLMTECVSLVGERGHTLLSTPSTVLFCSLTMKPGEVKNGEQNMFVI